MNIHMFCGRRPGLLLATMKALDNLGLDVQQAVISCFNGFALDVFRAEVRTITTSTFHFKYLGIFQDFFVVTCFLLCVCVCVNISNSKKDRRYCLIKSKQCFSIQRATLV